MKSAIIGLLSEALAELKRNGIVPHELNPEIQLNSSRQKEHGDYACNLAMMLAKPVGQPPRDLAAAIIQALPVSDLIDHADIAGPGFINLFIAESKRFEVLKTIYQQQQKFGHHDGGESILIEYVSANPTGPLHVGHGRGAAYGDALARLLRAAGHRVSTEYYVNDAGRQMDILALSVWFRYLDLCGEQPAFPANAYQGDYIWDIAADLHRQYGEKFKYGSSVIEQDIDRADGEVELDQLIARHKHLLNSDYRTIFDRAINYLLDDIRNDLGQFKVDYDQWFSERSLYDDATVTEVIEQLKKTDDIYQQDGAWWFRTTAYGDEKDRVVVRENGTPTYFASDIAYHLNKFKRGYDRCINIWGADHHGYIARVKAAMSALKLDPDKLLVLLVQFAVLYRDNKKVPMSTRSGDFVSLRELRREVGSDAARFFYVQRKSEQHMDFDIDLAKSKSNDNPMCYVQYAHARICSVFSQAKDRDINLDDITNAQLGLLTNDYETGLINNLKRYPDVITNAARDYEPHQIAYYLRDLANAFHTYYNAEQYLIDDSALRNARLSLIGAARIVLANGLKLLGVSAPEKM